MNYQHDHYDAPETGHQTLTFKHPSSYDSTYHSLYLSHLFSSPYDKQQKPYANKSIIRILEIQNNVLEQMAEVEKFSGTKESKEYLYLDDIISKNVELLDKVDGDLDIRNARKDVIKSIQKCLLVLEHKAEINRLNTTAQPPIPRNEDVEMFDEPEPQNNEGDRKQGEEQAGHGFENNDRNGSNTENDMSIDSNEAEENIPRQRSTRRNEFIDYHKYY